MQLIVDPPDHYCGASDIFTVDTLNNPHKASGLHCVLPLLHLANAWKSNTIQMWFLAAILQLAIFQSSLKALSKHVKVTV